MSEIKEYDGFKKALSIISSSEIIVGIPSRNSAHTIGYVLKNVTDGLTKYFRGKKASIIVCDGFSRDGTAEVVNVFRKHLPVPITIVPNVKSSGKGGAVRTIIEIASESKNLEALVLVDSDLRSIIPEWISLLTYGAMECGFAAPYYRRHKYDGTITNFIARPLTTMAYGIDLNQPIGGDFGLSSRLVRILKETDFWKSNPWVMLFGIDAFITHTALANNIGVCEVDLGVKIHEPKDPASGLKNMFVEVLGTIFHLLIEFRKSWSMKVIREIKEPLKIKKYKIPTMHPWEVIVSKDKAYEEFKRGLSEYREYYDKIFSRKTLSMLYSNMSVKHGLSRSLWAKVVYEAFTKYLKTNNIDEKERLLSSLFSLWQGRLYSYYNETWSLSLEEALKEVTMQIKEFFRLRDKFIAVVNYGHF